MRNTEGAWGRERGHVFKQVIWKRERERERDDKDHHHHDNLETIHIDKSLGM